MRSVLLSAIATMALVGCVGELDTMPPGNNTGTDAGTGGTTTSEAKRLYDTTVHPIMAAKCASCHSASGPVGNISGFVSPTVSNAHATAISFTSLVGSFTPNTAPVLLKVQAGHQGTSYSAADTAAITAWLNQEVLEQNGGGGTGGGGTPTGESPQQTTARLLGQWSGCMTKANFDAANMATAWGTMQATNGQTCENCHAGGDGGFIATRDSTLMFDVISSNKYYMLQYFSVKLDLTNPANSKVEMNTRSFQGVSQGQDPHREHPRFNATTNNGMTALTTFYNATMAAVQAAGSAGCGPSKLTN